MRQTQAATGENKNHKKGYLYSSITLEGYH